MTQKVFNKIVMGLELKKKIVKLYEAAVINLYVKPRHILSLHRRKDLYAAKSYYPEKESRAPWKNYLLQLEQIIRYGAPNEFFFMYGFDVKNREERNTYMNYQPFMARRNYLNHDKNSHNSTCILRNKLYFDLFARSIGVQTPRVIAYYTNNQLYSVENGFSQISFTELANLGDQTLFCKEMAGECGAGIFKLKIASGKFYKNDTKISSREIESLIHDSDYIFQELVEQHPRMSELYSMSVNTMRLVTVRSMKDGKIHLMPSILRVGANGSFVDNTSQGGLAVGFNLETGQLHQYGFHKPQYGLRTETHPDSGIQLSDFYIPFIKEAEERAIYFHSMLKDIHSIGWDIAIGKDGPVFIEGNDNWEINGPQVGNRGLKKEFEEYFYD